MLPPPLTDPPDALIERRGGRAVTNFGSFRAPVPRPNLTERWTGVEGRIRSSRVKEWQAFQLGNDEYFVLGAIYDAKSIGLLQLVVVHTPTGRVRRYQYRVPSGAVSVATGLGDSRSFGRFRSLTMAIENHLDRGRLELSAHDTGRRRNGRSIEPLDLRITGQCGPDEAGHLVICHPFASGDPLYSNKSVMAASGTLRVGSTEVNFDADTSFLILDDHKGHYPSPMRYDWVTGASKLPGAPRIGFNLTRNQVVDADVYNENALFIGPTVHRLGAVEFERPGGVHRPWRIRDTHGMVDVTFTPAVANEQHVGPSSLLADYYGPFGRFTGSITTEDGTTVSVDHYYGMGEQKYVLL